MVAAYRDGGVVENGQSATTTTATVIIPAAAQVGDVAVVSFAINVSTGTFTTPAGWTLIAGPDRIASPSTTSYVFAKQVAGGDPASTVPFVYSESRRIVGTVGVFSGVTLTGAIIALRSEATATVSTVLPTLASVPAGAMVVAMWERRYSAPPAPTITVPSPYTAGTQSQTAYTSSTNHTSAFGYQVAGPSGTYGGQSAASSPASLGNNYVLALPAAAVGAATVTGATATATALAPPASASADSTVTGQTASASATAPAGATSTATIVNTTVDGATATATASANPGAPKVPAFRITVTPEPDYSPPRVRIDITDDRTTPAMSAVITRRDADGRSRPVRTSDDGPLPISGGTATVFDYEPLGYRTQLTYTTDQPGAPSVTTSLDVDAIWLIHPGVPSRSVRVDAVSKLGPRTRTVQQGKFVVLEREDPIVVTGGARSTPAGLIGVRTATDAQRRALDLLLADAAPLLLNVPADKGWGFDSCYLAIGDTDEDRPVRYGPVPLREWALPYQVIGRPVGGTQAAITWDDIATRGVDDYTAAPGSQYMTWQEIADAGVTSWAELAAPTT